MNAVVRVLRGLVGLFVDDGLLALTVLGVLLVVALLTHLGVLDGPVALGLLVAGSVAALLANVIRAATTTRR
jgi:uncharacterized membrane protein YhhN